MSNKRIYLDCAATTPLDQRVLKVMLPYFGKKFGNPSSIHAEGVDAKKALEAARKSVGGILRARADEMIFTSGGTESNNLAIHGVLNAITDIRRLDANKRGLNISVHQRSHQRASAEKLHMVTTNIEHSSVLEPIRALERRGVAVTYVPIEPNGIVDPKKIAAALRPETVLVSVGYANNEIGTIQPISKIAREIRIFRNRLKAQITNPKFKLSNFQTPIFHTDACQAPLYLDCNMDKLGVDLLTLDGHKMYGPKGVGALYIRHGTPIAPMLFGGGQESSLRSTTENVAAIVGFARALEMAASKRDKESARLTKLRDFCHSNILENVGMTEVIINGDMKERLPNNLNLSFPGIDTEMLLLRLDALGIACSTKSSCLRDEPGSYVVLALGGGEARAKSTLRFSFGRETTKKDIDYLIIQLVRVIQQS
ncbi:MAG: cysteine desulfurase [Candidatus Taylorbacteria bacterium]|nr:cysteine desulfurase [Candidatus Taylorbacteria bacterium]